MTTIITGTSYFKSYIDAIDYYRDYAPNLTRAELGHWVDNKIKAGEIHTGKPDLKPGQRLLLNAAEGRYFIEEG